MAEERILEEVSERLGVPKEEVLREGIRLFLERELERVRAEISRVGSKYGVGSMDELWRRIEAGEVSESECFEDLVRLEYLELRLEEILRLLRRLT